MDRASHISAVRSVERMTGLPAAAIWRWAETAPTRAASSSGSPSGLWWTEQLGRAVDGDDLTLLRQPIFEFAADGITGHELRRERGHLRAAAVAGRRPRAGVPRRRAGAAGDPVTAVADPRLSAVLEWWDDEARELPWRRTRDPYAVWVSEVMLIQTQVDRVVPVWTAWMARWPDVASLAAARLAEVLTQWQGLGYPRRARDLHRSARRIADSGWPEDLTELPGVGVYVSTAVRCFARQEPVLPVDVNVGRVLRRRFAGRVDISADPWRAGQALMEFGQRVCTARPRCAACPVHDGCAGPAADPTSRSTRAGRFAGSLRQRRGQLLRRVLAEGSVPVAQADSEAAAGLVADGLVVRDGGRLLAPR